MAVRLLEQPPTSGARDTLLTVDEAAALLNVTPDWLYRRSGKLPFAVKLGRRTVRYSRAGIAAWNARHAGR